jgi:putative transposase
MPRKKYLPTDQFYDHVTARCLNKEWFKVPIEEVWDIFCDYLFLTKCGFNLEIYSFVLMNNHFHLIVRTPDANLSQAMNYFMRETSKTITLLAGRINQTYGGPYCWSIIKNDIYFKHAYKYVYRNPVEAGLVRNVEDYRFSTIFSKLGQSKNHIPLVEDKILFSCVESSLAWLNKSYPSEEIKLEIRQALARKEFQFARNKGSQKSELETNLI